MSHPSASTNRRRLFVASCVAIAATAMCFGVRAEIMSSLSSQFHLTNEEIGWIAATAFWGFTLSMFIGGQICDWFGLRRMLALAFVAHVIGVLVTIFAIGFKTLYCGTLAIGFANGFVEATINPLIPTLYPDRKTDRLNAVHVWFPGGIVIGGLAALACTEIGWNWQTKMCWILVPVVLYGVLFFREELPATERVQHQVSTATMYREALRPSFLVLLGCILLTSATELGPSQWIPSILTRTAHMPGILILIWITGLMAVGRSFAGRLVARISPIALLLSCLLLSAMGLLGLGIAKSPIAAIGAATLFALGICYCWPTMYGITSERFPAGGPFLLALMGSAGMLSSAIAVPMMGRIYDRLGPAKALSSMTIVPIVAATVLAVFWLQDQSHGGYRKVELRNSVALTSHRETTSQNL